MTATPVTMVITGMTITKVTKALWCDRRKPVAPGRYAIDIGENAVKSLVISGALALSALGLVVPIETVSAQQTVTEHYHSHYRHRSGHGRCLRFNKTTGSIAGGVGGALLGHAILGGPGGLLVGAAAGGIAGHELAHNRRKHC